MTQVIGPVDLETQMVIGVNHLVSHCILQMPLIFHLVGANQNSIFRVETTALAIRTATAVDIMTMEIASKLLDVIAQVADDGACTEIVISLSSSGTGDWGRIILY